MISTSCFKSLPTGHSGPAVSRDRSLKHKVRGRGGEPVHCVPSGIRVIASVHIGCTQKGYTQMRGGGGADSKIGSGQSDFGFG